MKISLSAKVVITIFTLVSIGGGLTSYLVFKNSTQALESSISSGQTSETKQTMDKVDRFLYERSVDVQQISGREQLQQYLKQPSTHTSAVYTQLSSQLSAFKVLSGSWRDMSVVDTKGNYVLTTDDLDAVTQISKQSEFKKAFAGAVSGQITNTDLFIQASENVPIMLFMSPVRDATVSGQPVIGVTVGELAWPSILEILQDLNGSRAELLNAAGQSLGDNNPDESEAILKQSFAGTPAFMAAQKQAYGSKVLPGTDDPKAQFVTSFIKQAGYLNYKGNGWVLVLETPKSVAFAPATHLAKTLIIIFAGILILSVLILLSFLRVLVLKPITDLEHVTRRLSKGDFSLRTTINTSDELGNLGRDFNDMADSMQFAYKNLRLTTKEAQSEKRTLQTLLDNLPIGVLVVNAPDGKPIMMNKAGILISGRGIEDDINSNNYTKAYDVIKEDGTAYPGNELPLTITLQTGKTVVKDDIMMRHPDGTTVAVRAITTPIKDNDGEIRRAVSVFEDISKERNLERSREEFFSIASHELRTPLTAIRGNTALIHDYFWDQLPSEDVKEMISDIHESSTRLIEIVNDFLDTSRLEQKRMNFSFEPIDMVEIAESVIKEYHVTSSRQKVLLEVKKPDMPLPKVLADRNRTKQVLINLVGNALKFTEAGSVTISFKTDEHFVRTLVVDTGKGIAPESQKFLFRKFEQAGTTVLTRDSVRGAGLGLYISKMIVKQMQGDIELVESQLGKGTTFGFNLPITKSAFVKPPTSPPKRLGETTPLVSAAQGSSTLVGG